MTDAPNFGTKFGWRKPCLRYIGPLLGITCGAPVGRGDHTPPPDAPSCSALYKEGRRVTPIPVGSGTPPPPRRGGPVCPPVDGPREGPWPGRHMGRPLQIQLKPPSTPGGAGGDRAPPLPSYQGAKQRADVGIGPYGTKGRPHRPPWPVAQGGASAPAVARGGWDMQQRASPKCPATSGNPSVALRATAPFAQGSLALWGTGERADT